MLDFPEPKATRLQRMEARVLWKIEMKKCENVKVKACRVCGS